MDTQATYLYQRNSNDGRQRPGNSRNGDDDNGTNPRKKGISSLRIFLFTIALVAVLAAGSLILNGQGSTMNGQPVNELPYSSFYQQVMNGNVKDALSRDKTSLETSRTLSL